MEVATVHALQCMCECVCVCIIIWRILGRILGDGSAWYRLGLSPPQPSAGSRKGGEHAPMTLLLVCQRRTENRVDVEVEIVVQRGLYGYHRHKKYEGMPNLSMVFLFPSSIDTLTPTQNGGHVKGCIYNKGRKRTRRFIRSTRIKSEPSRMEKAHLMAAYSCITETKKKEYGTGKMVTRRQNKNTQKGRHQQKKPACIRLWSICWLLQMILIFYIYLFYFFLISRLILIVETWANKIQVSYVIKLIPSTSLLSHPCPQIRYSTFLLILCYC